MYNSQLKTFIQVADCGSFGKAAEKLFISSTAVMKQINALEAHLELKLLERTNHGIQLTPAGESVYRDAKFLLDYSQKAVAQARLRMTAAETTFCVGTSMLNPCKAFIDLWNRINDDFPGYKLHIVPFEDNHEGILAEISALGEKYDFLVGVCDSALWQERCNFLELGRYKRCFAVPVTHPLAAKQTLRLEDLHGETLMMVKKGDSSINDRERGEIQRNHPQIQIEDTPQFYDIEVFNRAARTGSILSTIECWRDIHPAFATIPADWGHTIPYGLLYPLHSDMKILKIVEAVQATRMEISNG